MGLRQQACQVAKGGCGTGNGFESSPAAELLVVLGPFFFSKRSYIILGKIDSSSYLMKHRKLRDRDALV